MHQYNGALKKSRASNSTVRTTTVGSICLLLWRLNTESLKCRNEDDSYHLSKQGISSGINMSL